MMRQWRFIANLGSLVLPVKNDRCIGYGDVASFAASLYGLPRRTWSGAATQTALPS
jgi:hypothetical protein